MSSIAFLHLFPLTEAALPLIPTNAPSTNLGALLISPFIAVVILLLTIDSSRETQYSVGLGTATFIFLLSLVVSGS